MHAWSLKFCPFRSSVHKYLSYVHMHTNTHTHLHIYICAKYKLTEMYTNAFTNNHSIVQQINCKGHYTVSKLSLNFKDFVCLEQINTACITYTNL